MSTVFNSYSRRPVYDTSHSIATYEKWDPYATANRHPLEEMPMRLQFVIQGILCIESFIAQGYALCFITSYKHDDIATAGR